MKKTSLIIVGLILAFLGGVKVGHKTGFDAGTARAFETLSEVVRADWACVTLRDVRRRGYSGPLLNEFTMFPKASQAVAEKTILEISDDK